MLRVVKALQIADENKIAMPANWPNNELFGDEVIIPPPADEKTAATSKTGGGIVCEDWWFCHKKTRPSVVFSREHKVILYIQQETLNSICG